MFVFRVIFLAVLLAFAGGFTFGAANSAPCMAVYMGKKLPCAEARRRLKRDYGIDLNKVMTKNREFRVAELTSKAKSKSTKAKSKPSSSGSSKLGPRRAVALHEAALKKIDRGEFSSAADDFTRVLKVFPGNTNVLVARGVAYSRMGKRDEALADLDKALKSSPRDTGIMTHRAGILLEMGRLDDARVALEAVIKRKPRDENASTLLALVLLRQNQGSDAVSLLDRTAKKAKGPDTDFSLAWLYWVRGDTSKAADAIRAGIRKLLSDKSLKQHVGLDRVVARDTAYWALIVNEAKAKWPDSRVLQTMQPLTNFLNGDYREAIAQSDKQIAKDAKNRDAHLIRAMSYAELEDWPKVVDAATSVVEQNAKGKSPHLVQAHLLRAKSHWWLSRPDAAERDYERAAELAPHDVAVWEEIAAFHAAQKDHNKLERDLVKVAALEPDRAAVLRVMTARPESSNPEENLHTISGLIAKDQTAVWLLEERARMLLSTSKPLDALADCTKMISLMPERMEGYRCRGHVNADMRKWADAIADLERAISLRQSPALKFDLAYLNLSNQDHEAAHAGFSELLALGFRPSESHFYRAVVREEQNNMSGAVSDLEKALTQATPQWATHISTRLAKLKARQPTGAFPDPAEYPQRRSPVR